MRIGFVSREFPPHSHVGGIGTFTLNAAGLLSKQGHEIHVFTNGPKQEVIREENYTVHRIPMGHYRLPPDPIFYRIRVALRRLLPQYLEAQAWAACLGHYLESLEIQLDAIEYPETMGEGIYLPKGLAPLKVCCIHSSGLPSVGSWLERHFIQYLQIRACQQADVILSPSKFSASDYYKKQLKCRLPIQIRRNPIQLWISPKKQKRPGSFLFIGRIEWQKGIQVLLKSLECLCNELESAQKKETIHVQIIGPLAHKKSAENLLCIRMLDEMKERFAVEKNLKLSLEYLGPKKHSELPDYLEANEFLVFPSLQENYPYVLLEALSCGAFVIASAVGGVAEIIDEAWKGTLFPAGNSEILAAIMRKCIEDAEKLNLGASRRRSAMQALAASDRSYASMMKYYRVPQADVA